LKQAKPHQYTGDAMNMGGYYFKGLACRSFLTSSAPNAYTCYNKRQIIFCFSCRAWTKAESNVEN